MPALSASEARVQITPLLDDIAHYALQLRDVLMDERKALEIQDADAIEAIVVRKSDCIKQLQLLDRKREALCQAWKFSSGPEQMPQLIDWCDDNDQIDRRWQHLKSIATESSTMNMTNGAIIRARQQQFESSLSILRGVTPGPETYGRNGTESNDLNGRSIARA